ncbi:excinuclease ABC subunit UvrC [Guyparkeria sp.]|uniref:excinuclease ABC subunit UvrC n=1 Tax=Guyparkeria sp. TaxID=2035736 RepID=UPI0039706FCC
MTDRFDAKAFLASVTERPGVYRFLNADGEIIYVGKARNLKNRLSSYFRGTPAAIKTRRLVEQVHEVEITTTQTEAEALLLESNLIKAHRPRYNVLLRDDKSYPWIYVSTNERFPRLAYHRGSRKRPGRYFGPYPSAGAVRETLNLLEKVFKVRQCEDSVFKNRSRPCLQYQIERCKAPCVDYVDQAEYRQDVEDTMAFLSGRSQKLTDDLVGRMERAAEALDFEAAAALRDQIGMLRAVSQQQGITGMSGDADVIAQISEQGATALGVATIRDGRHLGTRHFFPDVPTDAYPGEVISGFLGLYYSDRDLPKRILCDHLPEEAEWLAGVFAEQAGHRVELLVPRRGKAKAWLEDTRENARIALNERLVSRRGLTRRFEALGEWLATEQIERIECFDISHTQGELTVASCVVFGPEGPRKDQYRRYHIEGIVPGDDYAAMHQALTRRFDRAVRESGVLPDVLLIDGGKGQLAQAIDVLAERDLADRVRVVGVAKGPERRPGEESLIQPLAGSPGLYVEDHLNPHDLALHLIQQVRDEAHRFAITGHRARRQKARTQSDLERIPGVGDKRRQALLKHFGGIRGLKGASVAELAKVPGVSPTLATRIHEWFHEGGAS